MIITTLLCLRILTKETAAQVHLPMLTCVFATLPDLLYHYIDSCFTIGTAAQRATRGASAYVGRTFEQVVQSEMDSLNAAGITADST